jgi:peptidyl-prolyl cis-trans isomerase C
MRLLLVALAVLVTPVFAQNPAAPARPSSKIVLTNSLDTITGGGVPKAVSEPAAGLPGEDVWAEGKGVRVTASAVRAKVSRAVAETAAEGKTLDERELNMMRSRVLETMIFVQLVMGRANAIDTNTAIAESKRRIENIIKSAPSEEVFKQTLIQAGYTEETFQQEKFEEALVVAVIDREVKSKVKIPESDIREYYSEDEARWKKPEQVRAAQIFFAGITPETREKLPADVLAAKRKKAEETLEKLKAGADFAAIAREISEDPRSKERGGEYVFQKGQMFPDFEKIAWNLKPGELHGEIVSTDFGFHLFKKYEVIPARTIPQEEVADQIREVLLQREMEVRIPEYRDRLFSAAEVKLLPGAPRPFHL